jgi:ATP-dependent Lon protease
MSEPLTDSVSPPQPSEDLASGSEVYLLALPDLVLFPGLFLPLHVENPDVIKTIDAAFARAERRLAVVARRRETGPDGETRPGELRAIGAMALIPRMRRLPDGSMQLLLHGQERVRVLDSHADAVPATAEVAAAPVELVQDDTITVLQRTLQSNFRRMAELIPQANSEMVEAVENVESPFELAYLLATTVRMEADERYEVLAADRLEDKLRLMVKILGRELELLELGSRIQAQAAGQMDKAQREFFLRQQLKAIRQELGEEEEGGAAIEDLRHRLDEAALPDEADKAARRELRRLEAIPSASPEHHVIRTYLEMVLELPWHALTTDDLDLRRAEQILNEDHYGLAKVKDRIVEYLAVRSLKPDLHGPILCFVGPPGVGKTSLGKSVARALGRKFIRQSLGGVHDEAEIRGHRRTYIGAMPGRIIEHLRRCGTRNPVFMLDEIDKLGQSFQGDPSSALLEVLDPAQNGAFRDNYLDLSFDLSQVLFICTANVLATVQAALLDRLEVIPIEGYTEAEKVQIAKRYLIPRQVAENGLKKRQFSLSAAALRQVIAAYTRESGVRNLERTIGTLARKVARRVAAGEIEAASLKPRDLEGLLGPEKVYNEVASRTVQPGVVTGLSVTATGGDVLFVEALKMPGKGQLKLTGQLGDVMKESAEAAFSYLRANAGRYGVTTADLDQSDYHLHVPAGAIPKDGPSAGVTMATALLSATLGRPADNTVAMTGELTLTGQVLPIGGLKEKILAARRAGIATVVLPVRNRADLADVPEDVRSALKLVTVECVDEVFATALGLKIAKR